VHGDRDCASSRKGCAIDRCIWYARFRGRRRPQFRSVERGGTDDTAALQTVLDRGSTGKPVHLVVDGVALVSGLNVYGNTTIECVDGGGLYLKDNSKRAIIRNVHRSRGPVTDQHITVRGCFLNGNRDRQAGSPEQPTSNQEADGTFISGLQFFGVDDLTVEKMTLWNVRALGVWIANAQHIDVRDVQVDSGSPSDTENLSVAEQVNLIEKYTNTDGIHFNGPIRYLTVDGLKLRTGDDGLAFNAMTWDATT